MVQQEQERPMAPPQAVEADAEVTAITEQELLRRKDFLEIGDDDVKRLTGINDLARRYAGAVIDDFYQHLLGFDDTRAFFQDPQTLQRVKNTQKEYFLRLTQGNYDLAYTQNRLRIGAIHRAHRPADQVLPRHVQLLSPCCRRRG